MCLSGVSKHYLNVVAVSEGVARARYAIFKTSVQHMLKVRQRHNLTCVLCVKYRYNSQFWLVKHVFNVCHMHICCVIIIIIIIIIILLL